jgi:hypothetical protein
MDNAVADGDDIADEVLRCCGSARIGFRRGKSSVKCYDTRGA